MLNLNTFITQKEVTNTWMTSTSRWTQDEEHLKEELYPITGTPFLKILDRSVSAFEGKASRMGLRKMKDHEPSR